MNGTQLYPIIIKVIYPERLRDLIITYFRINLVCICCTHKIQKPLYMDLELNLGFYLANIMRSRLSSDMVTSLLLMMSICEYKKKTQAQHMTWKQSERNRPVEKIQKRRLRVLRASCCCLVMFCFCELMAFAMIGDRRRAPWNYFVLHSGVYIYVYIYYFFILYYPLYNNHNTKHI